MRTEYQVNAAIGALKRSYENAVSNNRALDGKINELQIAKRHAENAKRQAEDAHNAIRTYEASGKWRGSRRRGFDDSKNKVLAKKTGTFVHRIETMIREIDGEVSRLRSQQNPFVKVISSFGSALSGLQRELRQVQQSHDGGGSR